MPDPDPQVQQEVQNWDGSAPLSDAAKEAVTVTGTGTIADFGDASADLQPAAAPTEQA